MRTESDQGEPYSPMRLLDMLEFRFGAFQAIAYASLELSRKRPSGQLAMDRLTAEAILEFGDDLRQANAAAERYSRVPISSGPQT